MLHLSPYFQILKIEKKGESGLTSKIIGRIYFFTTSISTEIRVLAVKRISFGV
jgi:hypothetical protein